MCGDLATITGNEFLGHTILSLTITIFMLDKIIGLTRVLLLYPLTQSHLTSLNGFCDKAEDKKEIKDNKVDL